MKISEAVADSNKRNESRQLMSIALPLMMGLALEQLIGMTDVLFLGRYGEAELAAAGVAGIYVMLVMMLGLGYTVGSQSLMSRANGAGRAEEVGAIFRQSAIFMTACGFVIMLGSRKFRICRIPCGDKESPSDDLPKWLSDN